MKLDNVQKLREISLAWVLSRMLTIWIVGDVGFYILLPMLDIDTSYSAAPIAIALYYAALTSIAVFTFWPLFRGWRPAENRAHIYLFLAAFFGVAVLFVSYALPLLPPIQWIESWNPPELMIATSWYFLPKSIEILLQQLLIAALVIAFTAHGHSVRTTGIWCAVLFGGAHMLLVFGGLPFAYVIRFSAAAVLAAFAFTYLLTRVSSGFVYAYALHWFYYALTIYMAHTISPYAQ